MFTQKPQLGMKNQHENWQTVSVLKKKRKISTKQPDCSPFAEPFIIQVHIWSRNTLQVFLSSVQKQFMYNYSFESQETNKQKKQSQKQNI